MKKIGNHNATIAKIRAMYGKRITPNDYNELINKQTVAEIAEYLKKNTHYSEILSSIETATVHRGMLEDLIKRNIFEFYIRIIKFENIGRKEFFNFKIISAEIEVILSCLSHINAKSENQITDIPIYLNKYTCFDLIEIAKVRSFEELLKLLERTPYHAVLKGELLPSNDGEKKKFDYNSCEIKLRSYYINRIEKIVMEWDDKTKESLNSMILTDVDLINVINSYRLTAFFEAETEVIEKNMLPFYGRLSAAKQKEIYSAKTEEEFINRFAKTNYGRQIAEFGNDPKELEKNANLLRVKYAKLAMKSSSKAPTSVYSFMYLMEIEKNNLISIIEGVRYGIQPKDIEKLIII